MGIPIRKKAWKLYDLVRHEYFVSRDVQFIKPKFPFSQVLTSSGKSSVDTRVRCSEFLPHDHSVPTPIENVTNTTSLKEFNIETLEVPIDTTTSTSASYELFGRFCGGLFGSVIMFP